MDKELKLLVEKIDLYIQNTEKSSFDDFLSKNKDIYTVNLDNSDFKINKDDIKFLYSWVIKGVNIDLIIDYFKNTRIKLEKEQLLESEINTYLDLSEHNFLNLILKYGHIEIYPKKIIFLWNNNKYTNIDIKTLYNTDQEGFVVKYVSYEELMKLYNKNKDFYKNNNLLINFNNLSRIIGVPISNRFLKLNYTIPIDISNLRFNINVYDNVSFNEFKITIDDITKEYKEINYDNIIKDFIFILLKKLKISNTYLEYSKLFMTYKKLSYYITYLFPDNIVSNQDKYIYDELIKVEESEDIFTKKEDLLCEHEEAYNNILIPSPNYFKNLNNFAKDYIDIINNVSVCKICHETLSIFDQDERSYVQKDGDIVLTSIRDNIFEYDPYKSFLDAQIFFLDTLNIFDNMFKTDVMDYTNNIAKLCIDFFIHLSENRIEFEKDKNLKKYIQENDLFFLRLSNKFFIYSEDKEEYLEKKKLNIFVIVVLVILIFSGFDTVKQIISIKNFSEIFENKRLNDEKLYNFFMSKVINIFLQRNKIIIKNKKNINELVDVYTSLFTDELEILYKMNLNTFDNNIKTIEGKDTIYIFLSSKDLLKDKNFILERFKKKDVYYRKKPYYKHKKIEDNIEYDNKFLTFLESIYTYDILMKDKKTLNELEKILNLSLFPKLYWENVEIKIRPKELNNDTFIINLDKTNKFININKSFYNSKINIKGDYIYCFFHFGDPFPFIKKLSKKHVKRNLDSIIRLIFYFFPSVNPPLDLSSYVNENLSDEEYIDRLYIYYIYYTIFTHLTKNKLLDWLHENEYLILRLYGQEHSKYFNNDEL